MFPIFLAGIIFITCEENMPPKNAVFFINRVNTDITIQDNSGYNMFEDIVVKPYGSKKLTYECPSNGSCDINFIHHYSSGLYDICVCFDNYEYNETYTFGYWPSNPDVDENEKCSSCRVIVY